MNIPTHHPSQELIYQFASGSKDDILNLIIATHIHYCKECQLALDNAEDVFGSYFEKISNNINQNDFIDKDNTKIFDRIWCKINDYSHELDTIINDDVYASPLDKYLRRNQNYLKRKNIIPYVNETILPISKKDIRVSIVEVDAGVNLPEHTHDGYEMTQILSGGFSDNQGDYYQGDFVFKNNTHSHSPKIFDNEQCKCLVVRFGNLKFTGTAGIFYNYLSKVIDI